MRTNYVKIFKIFQVGEFLKLANVVLPLNEYVITNIEIVYII